MKIEVFLDGGKQPIATVTPPDRFLLDTTTLSDGHHELRFVAESDDGVSSVRTVPFDVQNGPAIAIHGIVEGDIVQGKVSILANAYGSTVGDEFEPMQIETPAPIPTWAWVLFLSVMAWGVGYVSLELHNHNVLPSMAVSRPAADASNLPVGTDDWAALGASVYGNNCSSCHQATGSGLPGVFPPLKGNTVVNAESPAEHVQAVLFGVSGRTIDGVAYASPMPPFAAVLSDAEIAAVVNHERTQWGNSAPTVKEEEVAALRNQTPP